MSATTREASSSSMGSGLLANITAGTAQPITDAVIVLSDGGAITAATIAFVAAAAPLGPTITDSGNGFVTAGFVKGRTIRVSNSTSNDDTYMIKKVEAGTIELDTQTDLTGEAAGATVSMSEVIKPEVVKVTAAITNTGVVFLGPSSVSSANGDTIDPGASTAFQISDMSKVFVDVATTGNDVSILFLYNRTT